MLDQDARADDTSIPDATELWRRIPHWHWVSDEKAPNGWRPSSAAFEDEELSVVLAAECAGGIDTLLRNHEGFGVASFTVGQVRAHGWGVVRAPDGELPGHAHVLGKKSHSKRAALAKSCRMVRDPVRTF